MLYRFIQWTWGLLQTLVGFVVYMQHMEDRQYWYKGALVTVWHSKASMSLGMFIFLTDDPFYYYPEMEAGYSQEEYSRMILVHEYGHTIQSMITGPLYLFVIGAPSMLWSKLTYFVKKREQERLSYYSAYMERTANELGERFTKELSPGQVL